MINFENQVSSERLAAQYRDQLLFLLNQVEETSDNYAYALTECGVRVEVTDKLNQLRELRYAVENFKASQRG